MASRRGKRGLSIDYTRGQRAVVFHLHVRLASVLVMVIQCMGTFLLGIPSAMVVMTAVAIGNRLSQCVAL